MYSTEAFSYARVARLAFKTGKLLDHFHPVCQGVNHMIIWSEICSEAHRSHKAGFKLLPGILLVPSLLLAARHRGISNSSFLLGPTLQKGVLLRPSC